jgi:acyl-CoA synthetase (NDP forming)
VEGVPVFTSDAECVRGLRAMVEFARPELRPRFRFAADALELAGADDQVPAYVAAGDATEVATKKWLSSLGVGIPKGDVVTTIEEGITASARLGFPVVLKISDTRVLHKTEVGGVATGILSPRDLARAWRVMVERMSKSGVHGAAAFLIEEQVYGDGGEWIVGVRNDFGFGPTVTVGRGGVDAEAVRDFAVAPAPVDVGFARVMVESLRSWRLVVARGLISPDAANPLAELISAVSGIAWRGRTWLGEMDLNPVVLRDGHAFALDARVVLRH